MFDHQSVARGLLTFLCGAQGLATVAIDLGRAHATNPQWPGHARFHVVLQTGSAFIQAAIEIALICWSGPYMEQRFFLALTLAGVPMLAFLAAFGFRKAYGGTLSDPNGIPPARIAIFDKVLSIDLNLAIVLLALPVLGVVFAIYHG